MHPYGSTSVLESTGLGMKGATKKMCISELRFQYTRFLY